MPRRFDIKAKPHTTEICSECGNMKYTDAPGLRARRVGSAGALKSLPLGELLMSERGRLWGVAGGSSPLQKGTPVSPPFGCPSISATSNRAARGFRYPHAVLHFTGVVSAVGSAYPMAGAALTP